MGIISSIFGDRASAPQTGGFTVGAEIPKELAPYYKDILGKSQALYNDSVSQGFKPYTGPSLAEFTPEQQQAFAGISGLQGQQAPIYQEAMGMTRDASAPITTEEITEYMNPYQQAVVDIEKREATKQYQSQVQPQLAAQAARIQPFGGSRQAILEGMAADTQQRLLGDIQAKGSAQAYQDSVNLINAQRGRTGSGAGQLATLGSNQFKSQLGEIGALQTVGEEKQQLAQQALNEAYGQYSKEQEYPYQQLGRYQSVVTGAPIQQTQYVPPTPAGPSVGQQLLGGAATMLGTYGAFGGQMPNLFGAPGAVAAKGGGIAGLVKRQSGTVDANDALSLYKNILKRNPRPTARDLQEIQKLSNMNTNKPPSNYLRIRGDQNYSKTGYTGSKDPSAIRMGDDPLGPFKALANQFKVIPDSGPYGPGFQAHLEQSLVPDSKLPVFKNLVDAETLAELQNTMEVPPNSETFMSYIPEKKDANTGLGSLISNKAKDLYSNVKGKVNRKRAIEKNKNTDIQSPFNIDNRPSNLSEQEDVIPPTAYEQDASKIGQVGLELIGDAADAVEVVERYGKNIYNKIVKVGEQYFLNKGETSGLSVDLPEEGSGRQDIIENAKKSGIDLNIAANDKEAIERFDKSREDKRPDFDRGIVSRDDKIYKESVEKVDKAKKATVKVLENFYIDISSYNDAQANKAGHRKETINKAKDILDLKAPLKPKKLKNILEKPIKTIKEIDKSNSKINTSINTKTKKVDNIVKGYSTAVNKAEKEGKELPSSLLDTKQAAYLKAIEDMNKGLDSKDALIGKAQQESFWAFVARVGANISKGGGITESLAAELPEAMKDRRKLIQSKSDLEDKKLQGKVSLAKADLTIETGDAAALAARAKEERGYKSKKDIATINARGKTYNMKLPNFETSEPIIESSFNNILMKLNKEPAMKEYFLNNSSIEGIKPDNFNDVFKQFTDSSDIKNAIYARAYSDTEPFNSDGSRMTVDQLYRKHFDAQWKEFTGTYRKNNLLGISIPFTTGIKN